MVYTLRFFFSLKCSLFHNSNLFGSVLFTFNIQCVLKLKKIIPTPKKVKRSPRKFLQVDWHFYSLSFYLFIYCRSAEGRLLSVHPQMTERPLDNEMEKCGETS